MALTGPERPRDPRCLCSPLARDPAEVAGVIAFLLGPDATYLTGQVIDVDRGAVMG